MYNPETLASEARTRMIKARTKESLQNAIVTVAIFGIFGGFIAIPAIIRSSKAMRFAKVGDFDKVYELYQSSKKFINWSIVVGIIMITTCFVFINYY